MSEDLQAALRASLRGRAGCAVVLDIERGTTLAAWRPDLAKTHLSAPGSAIKPFTLRALLKRGVERTACAGALTIGGVRLDCLHPRITTPLDAAEALALSCNSWFASMSARLDPSDLRNEFAASGGELAPVTTLEALQLQALGVAGVRVSANGLARGYRELALQRPRGEAALGPLWRGLAMAVRAGTAQLAGEGVLGKTGTTRASAWFAGFNEAIVVTVGLDKGTGGGDAAPIAGEVFRAWRAG